MKESFEDYLLRLKERITEDTYPYTDEDLKIHINYLKKSFNNNLSIYKCLEFMHYQIKKYSYTIRDTECNSKVFGDCEICGKNVVQVFHQKKYEEIKHPLTNQLYNKFITDCYGHYDCLMELQKNNLT